MAVPGHGGGISGSTEAQEARRTGKDDIEDKNAKTQGEQEVRAERAKVDPDEYQLPGNGTDQSKK
jgi:hypothetical protein